MSYILEALKKSQQERELGQIPTLDASGIFVEDKQPVPHNYWVFLAVGLAALAVLIALYAAFRGGNPVEAPAEDGRPAAEAAQGMSPAPISVPTAMPPEAPRAPIAPKPGAEQQVQVLIQAPPPKRAARPAPVAPKPRDAVEEGGLVGTYARPTEGPLDPATEEALLRQLQAEQDALSGMRAPMDEGLGQRPERSLIPPDLVQDIESFKQQLRREKGIPPPESARKRAKITGDPTRLRLTAQQRAMVPAYLMTVHVYDDDLGKRFVVINGMKYLEGEETREGLRVEQILKEGAVLSYVGNPFYVPR
ncbi:general secretion pathway protein GspB [Thiorhodococcus minor]|uniref:GspB domain-containing protein n=1 Tax=Thiorhodococcus minor TaxID=57489 RepID=A0A6M0JZJ2_9GAMM|nr:general secretion pathway protein GspB [Thiorhodococcus minor]NEV61515.1 GspB domain-containing protein [Thiorhodococcus minor]